MNGTINCPDCGHTITVSEKGCNLVTCRADAHGAQFFYFCFWCRDEAGAGVEPALRALTCLSYLCTL